MSKKVFKIGDVPAPALLTPVLTLIDSYMWASKRTKILEFGSGHSTIWLAGRTDHLVTVEHEKSWMLEVQRALEVRDLLDAVQIIFVDKNEIPFVAGRFDDEYFDMVLIDCFQQQRMSALRASARKIVPGGWLILDDSHWKTLSGAIKALRGWDYFAVSGPFKRLDGKVQKHHTTFFRKPA